MESNQVTQLDTYLSRAIPIEVEGQVSSDTLTDVSTRQLSSGELGVTVKIGKNGQIIINDGTNDRVLIGYQKDGF